MRTPKSDRQKLQFVLVLFFTALSFSCNTKPEDYVCTPCDLDCDTLIFSEPGICPHCNMALIKKADLEKMNQSIISGNLKINYEFLDEESMAKEAEFTKVITQSFSFYKDLFGGNPRDTSDASYTDFTIKVSKT